MFHTRMKPVYGRLPPCANPNRLKERRNRAKTLRVDHANEPVKLPDFITYDDSDSEEESVAAQRDSLCTSYNFVDYVRYREMMCKEARIINKHYGSRHILTHEMFKETSLNLGNMNKVFCSQWLNDSLVVFGTKCNKLMVYDVSTHSSVQIPSLLGRRDPMGSANQACGKYSLQINPSRTLLATNARNTCEIAVYRLPTFDPVCVGENAHKNCVSDMCWLDDQFLVTGAFDKRMAIWRITDDMISKELEMSSYSHISAVSSRKCKNSHKVKALVFNKTYDEIATITSNGYIHIWCALTFRQKISKKLPLLHENICIAVQDTGLYAIGCKSSTLLLDARTLQVVKKIPSRHPGCEIRSASFQGNILTIATGFGILLFYDLRAAKYLASSINSSRIVVLKTSSGIVYPEEVVAEAQNDMYVPAIYTHSYDTSGTRLFTAGGPLSATLNGNYAGLWQ